MAAAFLLIGAVLTVAGAALWFAPAAGVLAAGILSLLVGIDLARRADLPLDELERQVKRVAERNRVSP